MLKWHGKIVLIALLSQVEIKSWGQEARRGRRDQLWLLNFLLFIFLFPTPYQYIQPITPMVKIASWKPAMPELKLSKL